MSEMTVKQLWERLDNHERICGQRWRSLIIIVLSCSGVLISGQAGLIVTLALRGH